MKKKAILMCLVFAVLMVNSDIVFGFRTAYSVRPGKLIIWGEPGYLNNQDEDAKPPNKPLPDGNDFIAVGGGKNMAFALKSNGVGVLWGVNEWNGWEDLAARQPLNPDGTLVDQNDAFTLIVCGRNHWVAVKKTGYLVTGGGYEKGGKAISVIPQQFQDVMNYEIPRGGKIIDIAGGGGYTLVILRRHNEEQLTGLQGGRLYGWSYESYWGEDQWASGLKGVNGGFFDCSTSNKQGGAAMRYDGTSEAFGWNNYGQANEPIYTVLDIQSGGYKLVWMKDDADHTIWSNHGGWPANDDLSRPFVSLSIGYSLDSILRADGSVKIHGRWADPVAIAAVEARRDILAVSQGNGVGIAIVAVDGLPVIHEVGSGRTPYVHNASEPDFTSTPVTQATEDTLYTYQAVAVDPQVLPGEGPITYRLSVAPAGMTIDANTGLVQWTPTNEQAAKDHVVFIKASDGVYEGSQGYYLHVINTNDDPVAEAGPPVAMMRGLPVQLNGRGSHDPDMDNPSGEVLSYEWDFDDSNGIQIDSTEVSPTTIYPTEGVYTATLTVRDLAGRSSTDTVTVNIFSPRGIYVATNGSDTTGDGTVEKPFKTITRALQIAYPEETIVMRGGDYVESVVINTDRITIRNEINEIPIIDGGKTAAVNGSVFTISGTDVVLQGLGIKGADSYKPGVLVNDPNFTIEDCSIYSLTLTANDGVQLKATASGATISGCHFGEPPDGNSNPATDYIKVYGIRSWATDATIENCTFANIPNNYSMYFLVDADRTNINGCEIRGTKHGIYFAKVHDCVVTNNLIAGLTGAYGIYFVSGDVTQNFTITFNTIADNPGAAAIHPPLAATSSFGILKYNILVDNDTGIYADGLTGDYNLVFGNTDDYLGGAVPGPHDVSADPLFEGDYYLDPYSPAANIADITAEAAGMNNKTTRLDSVCDFAWADAGYHRPSECAGLPPPLAVFEASPRKGQVPITINLDASDSYESNPGESIVSYDWDFGDSNTGSGQITSHLYGYPGAYTITLTVTSSTGLTSMSAKEVILWDTSTGGTNLLIIVSNDAAPSAAENNLISWLQSKGYTVTLADDSDTEDVLLAASSGKDVVVISPNLNATALQRKASNISVAMVVLHDVEFGDGANGMGFAADTARKQQNTLIIEDALHFITGPYSGNVQIFSGTPSVNSGKGLASSALSLATVNTLPDWSGLFVIERGSNLLDGFGTAPARRVSGLLGNNISYMNDSGKDLLLRAIQYAAGGGGFDDD